MDRKTEHRELVADVALLYTLYAEALDDGDIARWPSFFADEGPIASEHPNTRARWQ